LRRLLLATDIPRSKQESNKVLLVDGHAVAFHTWFTTDPPSIPDGFFSMLRHSVARNAATHLICTFDPAPPTFRHTLYPQYKANRPPAPIRLLEECEVVMGQLESRGIHPYRMQGYEADDLVGTIAKNLCADGWDTIILTSDLDLLQLVSENTSAEIFSQYWPTRHFNTQSVRQRFSGLSPQHIPDYKALAGDSSDNLPGVAGIGNVSATALLLQYGTVENIYKNLDDVHNLPIRSAKRIERLLRESQDTALLMKTLTTIVTDLSIEPSISAVPVTNLLD